VVWESQKVVACTGGVVLGVIIIVFWMGGRMSFSGKSEGNISISMNGSTEEESIIG
jgi:hypothetical protein